MKFHIKQALKEKEMSMNKAHYPKLLFVLVVFSITCFITPSSALCAEKEKIGVLFASAGEDETYTHDWVFSYFNLFYDLLPPGFMVGGPLEGNTCYTVIHYASEAESTICGVPEGTPIDTFCNEYTGSYPVHSYLDHVDDGSFMTDCYPQAFAAAVLNSDSTIDPLTEETIEGPHIDDPSGSGIGIADFAEQVTFDNMPVYSRLPDYKLPSRKTLLKWWYGNDALGYPPDNPEPINVKDTLQALMPQYEFVIGHGWEAYMENVDPYGNPSHVQDSTETAIDELVAAGVNSIIFAQSYPSYANLTNLGHEWYDENGLGISAVPGKTFKECVEDLTDGVGPETQTLLDSYLTDKPWDTHWKHAFPLVEHFVQEADPSMDLRYTRAYGEFEEFERAVLNAVNYTVDKYNIPQSSSLKIILLDHGNSSSYANAQDCDVYYRFTEEKANRVIARFGSDFSWQGQFEVVLGYSEMTEGSSDPATPENPFGSRMSVGEHIDDSINGQYVNAFGQAVDNGENNFDYIVTAHILYDSESSDTLYRIQEKSLGNNVGGTSGYSRDRNDKDGTQFDAGDVDEEYFTVKVFDATGWPSVPGCIEDPDCEQNNQIVYKGSSTNPTTVILGAPILSLDTSNQYGFAARQYLTEAMVKAIAEQLEEPQCPIVFLAGDDTGKTDLIRAFRDRILKTSTTGRKYVQLFYNHSPELTSILVENPIIKSRAVVFLNKLVPFIISSILNNETPINQRLIKDIEELCDATSLKASPNLRGTIEKLRKELKEGKIFQQLQN